MLHRMAARVRAADPLRYYGALNIAGDIFYSMSGLSFGNYARLGGAALGFTAGVISLFGLNARIGGVPARIVVMSIVMMCGVLYILSGLNVFRFEPVPRYGEVLLGACIVAGCGLNLSGRPLIAAMCFVTGTLASSAAAYEPVLSGRHADLNMFGAFLCFLTSNIVSRWIGTRAKPGENL